MNNITVKNVDFLHNFLKGILKFVPSCKFIINSEKCIVRAKTQESASRAFFTTNAITCDEEIEFCIGELSKFVKLINTFKDFNKDREEITLKFDGAFLILKDNVSFKLKNIDENVISTLTTPIKSVLKPIFGFTLNKKLYKKLISMSFISLDTQHDSKIYIYKNKEGMIVGEVNDRTKQGLDSVSIPLSAKTFGEWGKPIIVNFEKFKSWNLLECEDVTIFCANPNGDNVANTIITMCKLEKDDYYVKNKVVTSYLKS